MMAFSFFKCLVCLYKLGDCGTFHRNNAVHYRWDLARVIKTAQGILGGPLRFGLSPHKTSPKEGQPDAADPTHPHNALFLPPPSQKRYKSITAITTRLKNSFFPKAVNTHSTQYFPLKKTGNNQLVSCRYHASYPDVLQIFFTINRSKKG